MSLSRFPISRNNTASLPHHDRIELFDTTRPAEERDESLDLAGDGAGGLMPGIQRERTQLSQRLNPNALRQGIAKRKYNRYQESRYSDTSRPSLSHQNSARLSAHLQSETSESAPHDSGAEDTPLPAPAKDGRLKRGQQKVRGLLHRKRHVGKLEGDREIDVLYENQRGAFFFGYPLFSSNSLLNFDPPAWLNAQGKPSSVNITNAQVPDPSWEWAWTTWYVDMSSDVDEQGWQYSFMFQNKFPWHGTHPWLHSFVRRRRWIRQRVRKHRAGHDGRSGAPTNLREAHKLNSDYFTIHPASTRGTSITPGATSFAASSSAWRQEPDGKQEDNDDVDSIGQLRRRLRAVKVDREKIRLVLQFMDQGGQDLFYLSEEMPHIMSALIFQYSRRRLLSCMVQTIDEAIGHRQAHTEHNEAETDEEKSRIDNLVKAVTAADNEIQRLEFWSDIRDAVHKGESQGAMREDDSRWAHGWEGAERHGRGMLSTGDTTVDVRSVSEQRKDEEAPAEKTA